MSRHHQGVDSKDGPVAYAFVQDIAASWQQYELTTAATMEPVPGGLILHVAGPTAEGFRIIDVWETDDAWHRFQAERLATAIAALGGPARPEPTFRDVQADHVVFGGARQHPRACQPTKGEAGWLTNASATKRSSP
jgi:hypothetical protein